MNSKFAILITYCFILDHGVNSLSAINDDSLETRIQKIFNKFHTNRESQRSALKSVNREWRRLENPILFSAYLTRSYSTMSPNQTIPFENVHYNVGGGFDRYFGLFRAPAAGYYQFVLTSQAYSSSYSVDLEMVKNGNMICRAHAATYFQEGYCVAMIHLNINDDVWVRHYNGKGTYLYYNYHVPTFSGHLIKAD